MVREADKDNDGLINYEGTVQKQTKSPPLLHDFQKKFFYRVCPSPVQQREEKQEKEEGAAEQGEGEQGECQEQQQQQQRRRRRRRRRRGQQRPQQQRQHHQQRERQQRISAATAAEEGAHKEGNVLRLQAQPLEPTGAKTSPTRESYCISNIRILFLRPMEQLPTTAWGEPAPLLLWATATAAVLPPPPRPPPTLPPPPPPPPP